MSLGWVLPRRAPAAGTVENRAYGRVVHMGGGVRYVEPLASTVVYTPSSTVRLAPSTALELPAPAAVATVEPAAVEHVPLERLEISRYAWEQIHEAIQVHNEGNMGPQRETGGDLWGVTRLPGRVLFATLNVAESDQRSCLLGAVERIPQLPAGTPILLGCWHTHPGSDRRASPADLREWRRMAEVAPWIGLIVALDPKYPPSPIAYSVTVAGAQEIPTYIDC